MKIDRQTLQMAIAGFDQQIADLQAKRAQAKIAYKRALVAQALVAANCSNTFTKDPKPRNLSRGARNRIAIAQRKRWAEYRKKEAQKILRGRRTFRKKLAQ